MATLQNLMAADIAQAIADLPQSLTYKSNTYACVASDFVSSQDLQIAGIFPEADYTAHLLASVFTTAPKAGELITVGSKTLKIVKVTTTADANEIILQANSVIK